MLVEEEVEVIVQVNGKLRAKFIMPANSEEEAIQKKALSLDALKPHLEGKTIRKIIVVKGKVVNIVAN